MKRCAEFGIENPLLKVLPHVFDVFESRAIVCAPVSAMGPQLLSRLMELNETQAGVLNIVFRIADDKELLLIDLKDLRLMLDFVGKMPHSSLRIWQYLSSQYRSIQRAVLAIESQGGDKFSANPFDVEDLIATENGRGG